MGTDIDRCISDVTLTVSATVVVIDREVPIIYKHNDRRPHSDGASTTYVYVSHSVVSASYPFLKTIAGGRNCMEVALQL